MRRRTLVVIGATLAAVAAAQGLAALAWVYSGLYDFAATAQHMRIVQWGIETSLRRSVARNTEDTEPPFDLADPALIAQGFSLYRAECANCHGAPGVAPEGFALGLNPAAPPLVPTGRDRSAAEIYWTVRNGIRMTGMPAWRFRMTREEMWAVTAFVKALPSIAPADYARLEARAGTTPP